MNRVLTTVLAATALLCSATASAATYRCQGPNYNDVGGLYSTSMLVTNVLATGEPLPTNASGQVVGKTAATGRLLASCLVNSLYSYVPAKVPGKARPSSACGTR